MFLQTRVLVDDLRAVTQGSKSRFGADSKTLLRILCHRADSEASQFLKKQFKIPKSAGWKREILFIYLFIEVLLCILYTFCIIMYHIHSLLSPIIYIYCLEILIVYEQYVWLFKFGFKFLSRFCVYIELQKNSIYKGWKKIVLFQKF